MKRAYWLAPLGVALAAGLFSWLNRGERVIVHMGITTFYRAPLTLVLFLAFLAGMLAMMALTLRQDLRVRDALRARGLLDGHPGPLPETTARAPHALVDPYENGSAAASPHVDTTQSHPPFSGDGAAHRHDHPVATGDGDATLSHPPLADRTGHRPEYRAATGDGDATQSHPPVIDRTGHRPDDAAARVDGDAAPSHAPFAEDRTAYRRDEPAANDDTNATLIRRREGEPPTA